MFSCSITASLFSVGDLGGHGQAGDHHGTPSHLSVGGSSGWTTPTPTWTEGTPSFTESSKSGLEGLGQSSLDDVCDVCLLGLSGFVFIFVFSSSFSFFLFRSSSFPGK